MKRITFFLMVSILALGLTLPALGVDLTGKIGIGGLVSPVKPVLSDSSDIWSVGGQGKVQLKYGINKNFAVGLNFGYARTWNDTTKPDGVGFSLPSTGDATRIYNSIPVEVSGFYSIIPDNPKFNPYVTLGLGVDIWKVQDYTKDDQPTISFPKGGASADSVEDKGTELTVGVGGGLEYFFKENLSLNVGTKVTYLTGVGTDVTDIDNFDRSHAIVEGFAGVTYYIQRVKDSDKDGIKDNLDACPLQPEDFDGFQDDDGCPDPDNDNDGIPDISDKCPNEPEDIDGFQDDDGCPDPDNDNDGVLDVEDNCPNEAGPASNHGCPIVDSDNDGVLDPDDHCPNTPMGVKVDRYGCPTAAKLVGKMVLEGVKFASGKAKFAPGSETKLDELYESLKAYPEIRIEIQGYTDSWGRAKANKVLSQKRAEAVMNYLINKGIASYRLKAVGYGEKNPIASNKTKAGRAKNRRIEILPLK